MGLDQLKEGCRESRIKLLKKFNIYTPGREPKWLLKENEDHPEKWRKSRCEVSNEAKKTEGFKKE